VQGAWIEVDFKLKGAVWEDDSSLLVTWDMLCWICGNNKKSRQTLGIPRFINGLAQ